MLAFHFLFLLFACVPGFAAEVQWDAFLDTYYAYDLNRPQGRDRAYTTQPARHNEFNVNLALLGVTLEEGDVSARVSLQAGTYVQSNYNPEPTVGEVSGPSLSRHIQDAFINYQLSSDTEVIAGIFPSHIGYESVFSMDNPTYTRSLAADYSPYYQSGAGVRHSFTEKWRLEAYVLNGWQIISEDDGEKALGLALRYEEENYQVSYANYFGTYLRERRHFHDINAVVQLSQRWQLRTLFNWGRHQTTQDWQPFFTTNMQIFFQQTEKQAWSFRVEHYEDHAGVHLVSLNDEPFQVIGYSMGYDRWLSPSVLFRMEWRAHEGAHPIFPTRDNFVRGGQLFVMSLAAKF